MILFQPLQKVELSLKLQGSQSKKKSQNGLRNFESEVNQKRNWVNWLLVNIIGNDIVDCIHE